MNQNYSFKADFCFEFPTSKTFISNSTEMRRLKHALTRENQSKIPAPRAPSPFDKRQENQIAFLVQFIKTITLIILSI